MRREKTKQTKKKMTVFQRMLVMFLVVSLVLSNLSIMSMEVSAVTGSSTSTADTWDGSTDTAWYTTDTTKAEYTISTAEEFAGLASLVNAGTTFENQTINLAVDIDLDGNGWTAIGTENNPFKGIFDGNEHTISGLSISSSSSDPSLDDPDYGWYFYESDYQGLFGYVSDATIKNVGVINSSVGTSSGTASYIGGVVGYATSSTVENCYNTGTVSGSSYIGGVVGYATSDSEVSTSYNTGTVSGSSYIGGVVGYATSSTVSSSYNTGDINRSTQAGTVSIADVYIGGVVGYSDSTVSNSYNTGDINVLLSASVSWLSIKNMYIGGVVGSGTVTNSYNTGDVNVSLSANTDLTVTSMSIGGVGGAGTVTNSYSTGDVNVSLSGTQYISNKSIGGVGGAATVINSYYNSDNITDTSILENTDGALTTEQMTGTDALTNMNLNEDGNNWKVNDNTASEDKLTTYSFYPVLVGNEQTTDLVYSSVTVDKNLLSVVIDDQEIVRGMSIPTFTSTVSGNVNGEVITVAYSIITDNMTVGDYTITMTNTSEYANYDITVTSGTLTITDGYTVSFDDTEVTDIAYGATVSQPTEPTKDGYVFIGWYLGDSEFDFTTAITGDIELTSVWEAAVEKEMVTTGSAEVTIDAEVEQQLFDELFTEEEIALNVEMKVIVQVDIIEVTDMDESAQEEFTSYLEAYQADLVEGETVTQAIVFDISVIKSLAGKEENITELETPIRITIEIPEEYQAEGRAFFILGNHDGEITFLDDLDDDPTTFTMETDRFSYYTLNYVEIVEVDTDTATSVPDTGDHSTPQMLMIVMFTSLLGILEVSKKKLVK